MAAEQALGLPEGVLRAIGLVESGRPDPLLGRAAPWPWTMDVEGRPFFYPSGEQALGAARALRPLTADVGCFQISLLYHPTAFPDLARAFDPEENARVAARLLTELHRQTGSWLSAIAAYHSADPDRGAPYVARVLAAWDRPPGSNADAGSAADRGGGGGRASDHATPAGQRAARVLAGRLRSVAGRIQRDSGTIF